MNRSDHTMLNDRSCRRLAGQRAGRHTGVPSPGLRAAAKRVMWAASVWVVLTTAARAQLVQAVRPPGTRLSTRPRTVDLEAFDLTPVPPPTPALRHRLGADPIEAEVGNAAPLYYQAILLMSGADAPDGDGGVVDRAEDAHAAGRPLGADPIVDLLLERRRPLFDLLAEAARRPTCDWGVPFRQQGVSTMLPQLNHLRQLANLLRVRAWRRMEQGDVAGAVDDLRAEYALAAHAGQDMPVIGGLVGIGITAVAQSLTADLMRRPDAPNLYWALCTLSRPTVSLRAVMDGERQWLAGQFPVLVHARFGHETAADWQELNRELQAWQRAANPDLPADDHGLSAAATKLVMLPRAAAYYAKARVMTPAQSAKVDPDQMMAAYWIENFQIAADERDKLLGLPYAELLPRLEQLPQRLDGLGVPQDNPLVASLAALRRVPETFATIDRAQAALTAVEAVRSYAAGHDGRLPDHLSDVTDTPVPDNPVTGRPFEWAVQDCVGTLGDHDPLLASRPLEYTVHVRR